MQNYELTCLLSPDLDEAGIEKIQELIKVKSLLKETPKKVKLAYPVEKQEQAFLLTREFPAEPKEILELNKILKQEKNILRFLLIKKQKEEKKPEFKPRKPEEKADLSKIEKELKKVLDEE